MPKNTNQNLNWRFDFPVDWFSRANPGDHWCKTAEMNACRIFALSDFVDCGGWIVFVNLSTRRAAATVSNPGKDQTHVCQECRWIPVSFDELPNWSVKSRGSFKNFDDKVLSCLPSWFWAIDYSTSPSIGIKVWNQTILVRTKRSIRRFFRCLVNNALFLIVLVGAPPVVINLVADLFGLPRIW